MPGRGYRKHADDVYKQAGIAPPVSVEAVNADGVIEIHGGSGTMYTHGRCRCEFCVDAHRKRCALARYFRSKKVPATHGANAYANYRCRCDVCRQAWNEAARRQYKARKRRSV